MESLEGDYTELGNKLLEAIRPATFLCIGPACERLSRSPHAPGETLCLAPEEALPRLERMGRFDFAFVCATLERLPQAAGRQLLARLRDLHGGRFAVTLDPASDKGSARWSDRDLLAMGLVRARSDGPALYIFDIRTYKQTPDWLNSRFWANPGRWDKHWW
jgi:hypothetical protein